jgi:hypothetical protein
MAITSPGHLTEGVANVNEDERLLGIPLLDHAEQGFPADVELEPSADRYVGFYENQHGEQLVFVQSRGEQPTLYHGDVGWKPVPVEWPRLLDSPDLPLRPWVCGELILNQGEVLWLAACLDASRHMREGAEDKGPAGPLDRLLQQRMEEAFRHQSEHFDQQWSARERALARWREKQASVPSGEEDHYAEGAILVVLGLNTRQRRPRKGVTKDIRERIEREVAEVVQEVG